MKSRRRILKTVTWFRDLLVASAVLTFAVTAHQAFGQGGTIRVRGQEHQETVELPGASVHGFQETDISAKLGGFVKSIGTVAEEEVDVGSRVRQGDVLAVLDIPEMQNQLTQKEAIVTQARSTIVQADAAIAEARAAVAQSQARLEQARARTAEKQAMVKLNEAKLRRLTRLASDGSIGQENLDEATFDVEVARAGLVSIEADIRAAQTFVQAAEAKVRRAEADRQSAEAEVAVAEADVELLKTLMSYTVIKAPYDGVITRRLVDLGSYVQPAEDNSAADPVFQLTQISKIRVMVAVPNNKTERVAVGQSVLFDSIGGLDGRAFRGTVSRIAGALDPKTRTMQIEVHLDNPAVDLITEEKVELKPGLYGTLTVICQDWKSDNLLPVVPATAVGRGRDGNYYVTVMEGEKKVRRRVTIAFNDATTVGISSGLKIGETVAKSISSR